MMVEFKWISLFLPAVLQFTAAAGKLPPSFTVRVGDEVTLPCENVIDGQQECENTTWLFVGSGNTAAVKLVKLGQIGENTKAKSDRLSVTENCSLVIKKVTDQEVGRYHCRQFISKQQQVPDSRVLLSLIIMTERKDADKVTLNCSVSKYEQSCIHTVKWLYEGKDVDKDKKDMKTSQSVCYTTVSFLDSHFSYKSKSNLKCEVTDGYSREVQLFTFSPQSSGEKTGDAQTTTTTENTKSVTATTTTNDTSTKLQARTDCSALDYIMLVMRVAELLLITVITVLLIRARGNQRLPDNNTVTYSSVKASSSSAGASADPSDLYATVN